jgi:ethanolamine utilization protein EutA (predicted chaperonin)
LCLALLTATAAVASAAAINLNFSKSNVYRVTYHGDVASGAQVRAMLGELDKLGTLDESRLKQWLPANFKRFGIKAESVRRAVILPAGEAGRETAILLLSNPDDEARARAITVKSSTSNSTE